MDKDISYILENVIPRAKYNYQIQKYQLNKEDYIDLELSNQQIRILKNICNNLGIELDYKYLELPKINNIKIFNKYNEIKTMIDNELDIEKKQKLEKIRIEIRNNILTEYLETIQKIITYFLNNKYIIPEINNQLDTEEIYQTGYEIVLRYIDVSFLTSDTFISNIISLIMLYIKQINTLQEENNEINFEEEGHMSITNISKKLNIPIDLLAQIINLPLVLKSKDLSIESEIEAINNEESTSSDTEIENTPLYDNTFEEEIYKKIKQENIIKLINTILRDTHKKTLILLFGLDGNAEANQKEIADIIGYSEGNKTRIIEKSLEKLKHPLRIKYLKQIIGKYNYDIPTKHLIKELLHSELKEFRYLEQFLFQQMNKEKMLTLINNLNQKFKYPILLYLGYIEMDKTECYYYKSTDAYRYGLEYALNFLRNKIEELYVINNKNEDINNYLDYLMYNYLTKPKSYTRTFR